jgi:phosphatidylglycerophosphatase A
VIIRFAIFVCTFSYVGYSPIAPGTVGSLAGLAVYGALRWAGASAAVDAALIVALFILGVWSGTHAERYFGGTDPGPGVIDEVVGMLITLFYVSPGWMAATLGFLVFRILDVLKPYPANRLERLHGGLGMMADDAMAAVYSNVIVQMIIWIAAASLQ